ncbi:MAG: SCO family protein [Flavobacteriales bacterium]|nr:MAG: SCO family protein [Flavobacteriales bacterium]
MDNVSKRSYKKGFVLFFILLFPSVLYLFLSSGNHNFTLPIFGPRHPVEANENGETRTDTIYHTIPEFEFVNQYGEKVSHKDFEGKIYVTDFFFTTCKSICPIMSNHMSRVQDSLVNMKDVLFLSHTVDPEYDSVHVLLDYAQTMGAEKGTWHFVTGEKKELYNIARKGYFITAMEGDGGPEDFIHSEKFVLIDKQGRIRGYYDGTDEEDIDRLLDEVKVLKFEEFIPRKEKKNDKSN